MTKLKKILLVDDDPIQNLINSKLLERIGISNEIEVAVNGKLAFEKYIQNSGSLPEIIFLDINMPILNGWEFLDLLGMKGFHKMPKIYMLTSSISPDDIKKSEDHPMVSNYITKPLSIEKLEAMKEDFLNAK